MLPLLIVLLLWPMSAQADFDGFPRWLNPLDGMQGHAIRQETITENWIKAAAQVNRLVNRKYRYEAEEFDYWKTPQEFEHDQGGDCEDFAIYKYWLLLHKGIADKDMRIYILWTGGQTHAVLAVTVNGNTRILDNQSNQLKTEKYFKAAKVYYWINRQGWGKQTP